MARARAIEPKEYLAVVADEVEVTPVALERVIEDTVVLTAAVASLALEASSLWLPL